MNNFRIFLSFSYLEVLILFGSLRLRLEFEKMLAYFTFSLIFASKIVLIALSF